MGFPKTLVIVLKSVMAESGKVKLISNGFLLPLAAEDTGRGLRSFAIQNIVCEPASPTMGSD